MKATLFLFIVLAVIGLAVFVMSRLVPKVDKTASRTSRQADQAALRKGTTVTSVVILALAAVLLFFSSLTLVGTQDVGVVTSFGSLSGDLNNGLHFVAPWENVTAMDAAIQTNNHTGLYCMNVRIANQQTACVDVTIRWRIVPKQADALYKNYHSFANVEDSLVTRELASAVNNQLSNYNPLNSVSLGTASPGSTPNPSLTEVANAVTTQMQSEIGGQIEVLKTIIPIITFDPETQSRINQLQQQIALTRIAQQEIVTNEAQAQANKVLAGSVDTNSNVLVAQCLDILNTMVKNGQTVPVGFSCWPGSSGVSGIIVNSNANTGASGTTSNG